MALLLGGGCFCRLTLGIFLFSLLDAGLVFRRILINRRKTFFTGLGNQRAETAIAAFLLFAARRCKQLLGTAQFAAHAHPTHPGQEFVFVHSGTVELNYDGRLVELTTGDSAFFDAATQHKLRQVGDDTAVVVVVTSPAPPRTVR